jgi:competence protein ComGC
MNRRSFTIIEIVVAMVIVAILTTLVIIPAYQSALASSQEKICAENQELLKNALDIYAMEHDVMPGSLSELPASYTRRAYAQRVKEHTVYDRIMLSLAGAIISWDQRGNAYAQNFMRTYLTKGDIKIMTCPSDTTPPPGGVSYCLNANLAGKSSSVYKHLAGNIILIADCDNANGVFSSGNTLSFRHNRTLFNAAGKANMITRNGSQRSVATSETASISTSDICIPSNTY